MTKELRQKVVYSTGLLFALLGLIFAIIAITSKLTVTASDIAGGLEGFEAGSESIWTSSKDWKEVLMMYEEVNIDTKLFSSITTAYGMGTIGGVVAMSTSILATGATGFGAFKAFKGDETPMWLEITSGVVALAGMTLAIFAMIYAMNVTNVEWLTKEVTDAIEGMIPAF